MSSPAAHVKHHKLESKAVLPFSSPDEKSFTLDSELEHSKGRVRRGRYDPIGPRSVPGDGKFLRNPTYSVTSFLTHYMYGDIVLYFLWKRLFPCSFSIEILLTTHANIPQGDNSGFHHKKLPYRQHAVKNGGWLWLQ
jgi:hypothetical protein